MAYQYEGLLQWLLWGLGLLAIVWLVSGVIGCMQRRAYNLTPAESSGSGKITPDFLTVDHAARQQAIERGKAFDAMLAPPPVAGPVVAATNYSRIIALILSLSSFIAAFAGAVQKIEPIQAAFQNWSSWDRLIDIIARNKIGFAIAFIVILANLVLFVRSIMHSKHS